MAMMKGMQRRTFLSASAAAALLPNHTTAQDGLTGIFDGATLNGWSVQQGPASAFYVSEGSITVSDAANFPAWLRFDRPLENFDFSCEFYVKGWIDSAVYIHAPLYGPAQECGFAIKIFHKQEAPKPESMGSIFPLIAPKLVNVKSKGDWNSLRVLMDWPKLQVWSNGEMVQDLNVESHPDLRYRLRSGYLGLQSLSYPIRFRNLRLKQLPSSVQWQTLYSAPSDIEKWKVVEGKPRFQTFGEILKGDGLGHLGTKQTYKDFDLELYVRASKHSNGGVLFRAEGAGSEPHYEIQLHDVEGSVYPTGSLYGYRRAKYPRIQPEEWYLFQLHVQERHCLVRINGETVVDYPALDRVTPGMIILQAHDGPRWIEYQQIRIRPL